MTHFQTFFTSTKCRSNRVFTAHCMDNNWHPMCNNNSSNRVRSSCICLPEKKSTSRKFYEILAFLRSWINEQWITCLATAIWKNTFTNKWFKFEHRWQCKKATYLRRCLLYSRATTKSARCWLWGKRLGSKGSQIHKWIWFHFWVVEKTRKSK